MNIKKDEREKIEEFEMLKKKNPDFDPNKIRQIIDDFARYQKFLENQ